MTDIKQRPGGNRPGMHPDGPTLFGVIRKAFTFVAGFIAVLTGISAFLTLSGKAKLETLVVFGALLLAVAMIVKLYFYLRKSGLKPKATFLTIGAMLVVVAIALAASIAAFRLASAAARGGPSAGPSVSPSAGPSVGPSAGPNLALPSSIVIPMGAVCQWAYPGQASGKTIGSLYNTYCLGRNGQNLGGFSGMHSLNNWCAIPSHTDGENGLQPELVNEIWECT